MKAIIYILVAAMCLIPASEAGAQSRKHTVVRPSGQIVTRNVPVSGSFTDINARGSVDVEYRQSSGQTKVEIRGHENLIELVEVENRNGTLEIKSRSNTSIKGEHSLKVIVTSPQIARIMAYGSGDVRISDPVESDRLEVTLYGSGDMKFGRIKSNELRITLRGSGDIDGQTVDASTVEVTLYGSGDVDIERIITKNATISLSGSGDIEMAGQVKDVVYTLRGSGDMDTGGLCAENVNATLSGSGDISCHASSSLRAAASGSGSITVSGNPPTVEIKGNKKAVRLR